MYGIKNLKDHQMSVCQMKYIDLQAVKRTDAKIYSELLVSFVAGLLSGRDFFLSIFFFSPLFIHSVFAS